MFTILFAPSWLRSALLLGRIALPFPLRRAFAGPAPRRSRRSGGLIHGLLALLLNLCAQTARAQEPGSAGVWDLHPEQRWVVSEGLRIGGRAREGQPALRRARCVAVDPLDRIWVVVDGPGWGGEIRVFEADGSFVRVVGRWVEGRGGFREIGDAFSGPGEEIWVEDRSTRRYEVFDTAGTWVRSHPFVFGESGGGPRVWTRQGLMAVRQEFGDAADSVRFYELAGSELRRTRRMAASVWPRSSTQTFAVEASDRALDFLLGHRAPIPYAPENRAVFGSELDLWMAFQIGRDRYHIRRTSLETGDDLLSVTHRYEPAAIPESVRRAKADSLADRHTVLLVTGRSKPTVRVRPKIDWKTFPLHYPSFQSIHLSASGELWVRRLLAGGVVGFDVFAPDGRYLGQPAVPRNLVRMDVQVVTRSRIYAVEAGGRHVVRFDVSGAGEDRAGEGFLSGCGLSAAPARPRHYSRE